MYTWKKFNVDLERDAPYLYNFLLEVCV